MKFFETLCWKLKLKTWKRLWSHVSSRLAFFRKVGSFLNFVWYFSDSGDVQLFEAVKNNFESDLPKETIQWKRNYGRASKNVILNPKFEQFDPQSVSSSSSLKSLLGQPLLHIFWAECMVRYFQLNTYLNFIKKFIKKNINFFE